MVGFERTVVHDREPEAEGMRVGVQPEQIVGGGIGKRVDQHAAHDADHGGGRAQADADREHDRRGERGGTRETAKAVDRVPPQVTHERSPVADGRPRAVEKIVQGIQEVLAPQPPCGGAIAVLAPAQLVELGEVVLDGAAIGLVQQDAEQPAHRHASREPRSRPSPRQRRACSTRVCFTRARP